VNDTAIDFAEPSTKTAMAIDGPIDLDATHLVALTDNGTVGFASGFAGRGLYGNYILLFPKCELPGCSGNQSYSDAVISSIQDVLLRFDIVFVTNAGSPTP
jgi:hypothetical protein